VLGKGLGTPHRLLRDCANQLILITLRTLRCHVLPVGLVPAREIGCVDRLLAATRFSLAIANVFFDRQHVLDVLDEAGQLLLTRATRRFVRQFERSRVP
jgi:hypothetical protein